MSNVGVNLSLAQRQSLISLRDVEKIADKTTLRISTGKSVESATDDAIKYFQSASLDVRAREIIIKRDNIQQGITALNTAVESAQSIDKLLRQLRGVAESTRSQTQSQRTTSSLQFREILNQISALSNDATYQGKGLLNSSNNNLNISFSNLSGSSLSIKGVALNGTGQNLFTIGGVFKADTNVKLASNLFTLFGFTTTNVRGFTAIGTANSLIGTLNTVVARIDSAIKNVTNTISSFSANASILSTRLDFTTNYTNKLTEGSKKLTDADLNEEATILMAMQTRKRLALEALSITSKNNSNVLRLMLNDNNNQS